MEPYFKRVSFEPPVLQFRMFDRGKVFYLNKNILS